MGEAKRRGSRDARIVQSLDRQKREAAELAAQEERKAYERAAQLGAMPADERREYLFQQRHGAVRRAHLGTLLAIASGAMAVTPPPAPAVPKEDEK